MTGTRPVKTQRSITRLANPPRASSRSYALCCRVCGRRFEDDGRRLACAEAHDPGLLVTEYEDRRFEPLGSNPGIYRYAKWLPSCRTLAGSTRTFIYRSERLMSKVGLPNLWIAFHGYHPERDLLSGTCTFKDLEAYSVLARFDESAEDVLVVASAGNTAAAFARCASLNGIRCLVIVPEAGLARMEFSEPLSSGVKVIAIESPADYAEAIAFAHNVAHLPGFFSEGGSLNVGRRDGLATVLLSAVEAIGALPDYYFQAIGSGAGALAVHEAALRLSRDGRFGTRVPRQMLSQNLPFVPIYRAWKSGSREWIPVDASVAHQQIAEIEAGVLSNRTPPYSTRGGVFDTLTESQGDMLVGSNDDVRAAAAAFEEIEKVDIEPSGALALATLVQAVRSGRIDQHATVLLNVTGAGFRRRKKSIRLHRARPDLIVPVSELHHRRTLDRIAELFA